MSPGSSPTRSGQVASPGPEVKHHTYLVTNIIRMLTLWRASTPPSQEAIEHDIDVSLDTLGEQTMETADGHPRGPRRLRRHRIGAHSSPGSSRAPGRVLRGAGRQGRRALQSVAAVLAGAGA